MQLQDITSPVGSRKKKKIVGRGRGSGLGKTSGRGENGQNSRRGRGIARNLEGGQMPLIRRLPKVGFRCHRPVIYQIIDINQLAKFEAGTEVDAELLKKSGMIANANKLVKILGDGELSVKLTVKVSAVSKSASEKILKAGGTIETAEKNINRSKKVLKKK